MVRFEGTWSTRWGDQFTTELGLRYDITFPETYWLPIIPSFGISYEF